MMRAADHIMIDLETLALTPDATIIQIGAVAFDLETGTIEDTFVAWPALDQGRAIDADTVAWWMRQDDTARLAAWGTERLERQHLADVLVELDAWAAGARHVWANSPAFDCVILRDACRYHGLEPWWRHTAERDVRTLAAMATALGWIMPDNPVDRIRHDALSDAMAQVRVVSTAWGALNFERESAKREAQREEAAAGGAAAASSF